MEHPFKIILKAFGIVIFASIVVFVLPKMMANFGTAEWYLLITVALLFSVLMLVQIHSNSKKLSDKIFSKSRN